MEEIHRSLKMSLKVLSKACRNITFGICNLSSKLLNLYKAKNVLTTSAMVIMLPGVFIPLRRRSQITADPGTPPRRLELTPRVHTDNVLVETSSGVYVTEVSLLTVNGVVVAGRQENWTFAWNMRFWFKMVTMCRGYESGSCFYGSTLCD